MNYLVRTITAALGLMRCYTAPMNFPSIFGAVGVVIGMVIVIVFAFCLFYVGSLF